MLFLSQCRGEGHVIQKKKKKKKKEKKRDTVKISKSRTTTILMSVH